MNERPSVRSQRYSRISIRGVGHAFGADRDNRSEVEDEVGDEGAAEEEAEGADAASEEVEVGNSTDPTSTDSSQARVAKRRRLASLTTARPSPQRRRLRDLPSRRVTAATATLATESQVQPAAATNPSTTMAPASGSSSVVDATPSARCPVCMGSEADTALIPCGHCACIACVNKLLAMSGTRGANCLCPVCRTAIRDILSCTLLLNPLN